MDKYEVLKTFFGYDSFRHGQAEIIEAAEHDRDVLGVMPTGGGKSICYQVPALMKSGFAIVISPLISLMQDQVRSLVELGIRAAYINSSLTMAQLYTVINNCAAGVYKLVYVAPERLDSEVFLEMAVKADISMICVDEAHCISQWGQDFRPSYLAIPDFIAKLPKRPVVAAFTATATRRVREDIREKLCLKDPFEIVTGFDRENLYFEVRRPADKGHDLLKLVRRYNAEGRSGIIYCATRKEVEKVCELLRTEGIPCTRYHAGLSDEERKTNQDDFIYDRIRVITATNAFGMGIDKSNVSFVIHYNMPKDLESYYQEAGRAGRDGSPSDCILMYSPRDTAIAKYLIEKSFEASNLDTDEAEEVRQRDMKRLFEMVGYAKNGGCLRSYILRYFGEYGVKDCCNCSSCCGGAELSDITVDSQKIMSCIFRGGEHDKKWISDVLRGELSGGEEENGPQTLSTFGIMSGAKESYILDICRVLDNMGYVSTGKDGRMSLLPKSLPVLRGQTSINARLPSAGVTAAVTSADQELFTRLRRVRDEIARRQGVPAYNILTDSALTALSEKKPVTERQFLAVQGITRAKFDRFGDRFIAEIAEYRHEKDKAAPPVKKKSSAEKDPEVIRRLLTGLDGVKISDEPVNITAVCNAVTDRVMNSRSVKISSNILRMIMLSELEERGYIKNVYDDRGHLFRETTDTSGDIGMISETAENADGESYTKILYTRQAQEYMISLICGKK